MSDINSDSEKLSCNRVNRTTRYFLQGFCIYNVITKAGLVIITYICAIFAELNTFVLRPFFNISINLHILHIFIFTVTEILCTCGFYILPSSCGWFVFQRPCLFADLRKSSACWCSWRASVQKNAASSPCSAPRTVSCCSWGSACVPSSSAQRRSNTMSRWRKGFGRGSSSMTAGHKDSAATGGHPSVP